MVINHGSMLTGYIRNLSIYVRRFLLGLILLVPQGFRARLARSRFLTRCFEFFDRAKYESIVDPSSASASRGSSFFLQSGYDYRAPECPLDCKGMLRDADGEVLFSILMPVYNTQPDWLERAVASVQAQWYPHWELCIVDDCSTDAGTVAALGSLNDERIRVQRLERNRGIVGASNAALGMARGEFVALMDHDDELTPDALYEMARAIGESGADFIYSDEDKIDHGGRFCEPHFKPDFSPDTLLSQNYISHLGVIRRSLADATGGFAEGTDGAQDHDLYLRVAEMTDRIEHVPKVLYHWRKVPGSTASAFSEKSYAQEAGERVIASAMERRGVEAEVTRGLQPGTYRVRRLIAGEPLVSIVIPFRDKPELLNLCIGSILKKSSYTNFEIVGISNNSREKATERAMERWAAASPRIRFIRHDVPFNYSGINNFAVREHAQGEHVILLNNDIEIIAGDWIENLLQFSQRPDVGAVGGKLLYPDGRLQHAGIILGIGGVAGHSHKYFDRRDPGYFARPQIEQNVSAVTGACLMVKKNLYHEVGGLDENNLRIAFNDVDFCLRLREKGYLNVYTPYCEAWHHESISRGQEDTPEKQERFRQEVLYMMDRHQATLTDGDPYYNPNLTLEHENFMLKNS